MRVVILVPRRNDDGWRDRLWKHCKAIWEVEFPEWPVLEGYHEASEGPFNRSAAINRASTLAGDWDVALVIDSDTISEPGAVRRAVQRAWETGDLSIAHNARLMLTRRATDSILAGTRFSTLSRRQAVKKTYYDSISCAVAVRRAEWDAVNGFDERFEGWGFEDTAFRIAVETLTGRTIHVEQADCLHLWHEASPEASQYAPTFSRNMALKTRYERGHFQPERIRAVLAGLPDPATPPTTIPRILHRTVPEHTTEQVEAWWARFAVLHPDWELRTWRDPLDPADFPLTAHLHEKCASGAQKAGLVRLELLVTYGGVYVDSDVEAVRPLDALTHLPAFAAWEDEKVVPDAVLGAAPGHPAFREMLSRACRLVEGGSIDAWETGPGVTTAVLPWRDDVLLLPPGSFYPVHYKEKQNVGTRNNLPWVFLEHKWHHSWASSKKPVGRSSRMTQATEPQRLEKIDVPGLAVCMPWRDGPDGWRRQAHAWCVRYWEELGIPVFEGDGRSRAEMCNTAAAAAIASGARILLFADADTWGPADQVIEAARLASETGQLVHAFTGYHKIDQGRTRMQTRSDPARVKAYALARTAKSKDEHVSGLTAVPVELWNQLGGFDERFAGWGFEDQAFHLAAETIGGGTERVEGPAIHWHHRIDPTKSRTVPPDDPRARLMAEYCAAAGRTPQHGRVGRLARAGHIPTEHGEPNADRMQDVLSGPGGPLSRPDAVS